MLDGGYDLGRLRDRRRSPLPFRSLADHVTRARPNLLMEARTMTEIREVAAQLGLTFKEAYQERARLYETRWGVRD
jgi:hypothetical protein